MHEVTLELARRIAASSWPEANEAVGDEVVRSIVNWLGTALSGTREAFEVLDPASAQSGIETTTLGLGERFDAADVAMMTAAGADAMCYVDTHLPTMLHPAATIGAVLLPLSEHLESSGAAFVHAFLLGVEVACRTAKALPATEEGHASLVCNALGAAAGCARLAGCDAMRIGHALDLAWAAAVQCNDAATLEGLSARAARIGLLAALGDQHIVPAAHASPTSDCIGSALQFRQALFDGWGADWECARLGYHAYPCLLQLHPVVEACLQLKRIHHLTARQTSAVEIRMPQLAIVRGRGPDPERVEDAKRSIEHAAAIALLDGEAGLEQFESSRLRSARTRDLRAKCALVADERLPDTAAHVSITLPGGEKLERLVRCALGHPMRPLSDHDLSDKFRRLAADVLATDQAERLLGLAWNIRALTDLGGLIRASVPEEVIEPTQLPGSPLIPR